MSEKPPLESNSYYLLYLVAGVVLGAVGGHLKYEYDFAEEYHLVFGLQQLHYRFGNTSHIMAATSGIFVGILVSGVGATLDSLIRRWFKRTRA